MTKLHNFLYLVNCRFYKVVWLFKMNGRIGLLWMFYDMYTPQTTGGAQKMPFLFFWILYNDALKVSISRELYIILNWLNFQNYQKTH